MKPLLMLCPSADITMDDPVVMGVIDDTSKNAKIGYLRTAIAATPEILSLASPSRATEVFRLAANCMGSSCVHQSAGKCSLINRIVKELEPVTDKLPPCSVRSKCIWWNEKGVDACLRCPQIITTNFHPSQAELIAAGPQAASSVKP